MSIFMDEDTKKLAEELLSSGDIKHSFVKNIYLGTFDSKSIFPFPQVSKEEHDRTEKLLQDLKRFLDEKLDPVKIDKESFIPDDVIKGLGKLGILSLTIPKEYGGLGMSQYAYCKAMELISSRCASTALFVNAHQSVGLKALLLFGTKEQREKWLPPLGKGEALAAFSLTEPNAGSDAAGITTTAVWDEALKKYRINGKKQWTTNGSIAKVVTVMAKVDGKVTAFLVSPDMKGFEVAARALDKVGMRGSVTSNINYNDVEVPKENILGPVGGGLRVCLTVLDYGRTTFGATCLGVAKKCLDLAMNHAKTRIQFKRPLASFQLVREKLAKMAAYTYAIEATTYLTAGLIDNGQEDVMLESAILKVFSSDSSWVTLYDTMQIFGGRSLFTDKPLERMMRDARLNMIGEGSNEVLRVFIAVVGLKGLGEKLLNVKNKPSADGILSALKPLLPGAQVKVDKFQFALDRLLTQARKFHRGLLETAVKYGEGVVEKQLILNRIAEMAIALYTSSAVISKLQTDPDHDEEGLLYLDYATRTFDLNYSELFSPRDAAIDHAADKIIGKL